MLHERHKVVELIGTIHHQTEDNHKQVETHQHLVTDRQTDRQTDSMLHKRHKVVRHVSFMRIHDCRIYIAAFFARFSKVRISHIFLHKLALSMAILILLEFLFPISIRFRYLDHLVANRKAPSMCPDPCGTSWGSWFQVTLGHISAAYLVFMRSTYFSKKCHIKLTCLSSRTGRDTGTCTPVLH